MPVNGRLSLNIIIVSDDGNDNLVLLCPRAKDSALSLTLIVTVSFYINACMGSFTKRLNLLYKVCIYLVSITPHHCYC